MNLIGELAVSRRHARKAEREHLIERWVRKHVSHFLSFGVWLLRKFRRSSPSNVWWRTRSGREGLSRPSAAEGGGRRSAFTGLLVRTIINHRGSTARLRDGFSPLFFCDFTPPLTSFIGNRLCRGYCC